MRIRYSSTNSGGSWWLSDEDWKKLEESGWKVNWIANEKDLLFKDEDTTRWLGALAIEAEKDFPSVRDAILDWEKITRQEATQEGCNCCGAPHTFYWGRAVDDSLPKDSEYGYASGEDLLAYLFPNKPIKTKRELMEEL